jgi:hypothetical protein
MNLLDPNSRVVLRDNNSIIGEFPKGTLDGDFKSPNKAKLGQ